MLNSKRYLKNSYLVVSLLIVMCGLLVTIANYYSEVEKFELSQYKESQAFVHRLHDALDRKGLQVSSMLSFIQTLDSPLRPEQFTRMTAELRKNYHSPKVTYFFSRFVSEQDKKAYEERQRLLTGNPFFAITPLGSRPEYLPLTYTSPDDFPHGYDVLSPYFTDRDENILARNNHSLLLSKPLYVGFNKDVNERLLAPNALIIRHSIYISSDRKKALFTDSNGFYGVVGLHFKIAPFLRSIPSDDLAYRILDVTDKDEPAIEIGSNSMAPSASFWQNRDTNRFYFSYGGRDWQIETAPFFAPSYFSNGFYILMPFILSLLLAALIGVYIRLFYLAYNDSLNAINERVEKDELTGLSSRFHMQSVLSNLIEKCCSHQSRLTAFFLDLDHFKTINDAFGHEVGDKLLLKVSQRLTSILPSDAHVARLGGDEFLVLMELKKEQDEGSFDALLNELILQLSQSYFIDNRNLNIGCSIGVTFYPADGLDAETIVKNSEMAMYQAKVAGRSTYRFYDAAMGKQFERNVRIETRLRRALKHGFLEMHFQPKVDLKTERCVGMEALMRWEDEELGIVSPAEFIPIAEQTGIIMGLGEWSFEQTCRHIVQWKQEGIQVPPIAVNFSAVQLKRPDFLPRLLVLLDKYDVDPSELELEVTESILIEDAKGCAELLRQLSRLGMKLSIDDFGTGYSSLSYLKDLPFDCVKIDQVFIRDIIEDSSHAALTKAIIRLSHDLNLQVIAEGITNQAQLTLLREYGCDIGQGYLFSKAMGANSMASDPMIIALNEQQNRSDD